MGYRKAHISARPDLRSVRFACTPTDSISIAAIAARAAASFNNFQYEIRLIAAASVHNEAHFCADVRPSRPDFALEPVLICDIAFVRLMVNDGRTAEARI